MKQSFIRNKSYLFIPLLCAFFWIFLTLLKDNFYIFDAVDFDGFYYASRKIYLDPGKVYVIGLEGNQHYYLPCFATLLGLITVFLTYNASMLIFFIILVILTILLIIEFDRLLESSGISEKYIRILILLVFSNSYSLFLNFDFMQSKLIPIFSIILFLRREIQYRNYPEKFNEKTFLFVQMMIFLFGLGLIPQYFIFFSIIYLFHGISWKKIFNKSQLKKYGLFILVLCVQNFMFFVIFIVNPDSIFFLFKRTSGRSSIFFYDSLTPSEMIAEKMNFPETFLLVILFFINEFISLSFLSGTLVALISMVILLISSLILAFWKDMQFEIKISYFALTVICFSIYYRFLESIIFLPLVALLFIVSINDTDRLLEFIKSNFFWLLGLLSLFALNLVPKEYFYYKIFPFLTIFPVMTLLIPIFLFYLLFLSSIYFIRINPKFKKEQITLGARY